jgi:hypothetical protein
VDPVARKIADALPAPNTAGAVNYFTGIPNRQSDDRFAIRGDHRWSARGQLFGRYQVSRQVIPQPSAFSGTILSTDNDLVQDARGYVLSETHTITSSSINAVRFGRAEDSAAFRSRAADSGRIL